MRNSKLDEKQIAMLKAIFDHKENTGSYVVKTHPHSVGGKLYFFTKAMAEGLLRRGLLVRVDRGFAPMYKVSLSGLQYVI